MSVRWANLLAVVVLVAVAGCRAQPKPAEQQVLGWRAVGSWSGHGNVQTESFTSDSGQLRVRWRTTHEASPGAGAFRLTAHSAISGRPLQMAVDNRGQGEGTSYVVQDPHVFYVVVESDDLDWSFTVDDAVAGIVEGSARPVSP